MTVPIFNGPAVLAYVQEATKYTFINPSHALHAMNQVEAWPAHGQRLALLGEKVIEMTLLKTWFGTKQDAAKPILNRLSYEKLAEPIAKKGFQDHVFHRSNATSEQKKARLYVASFRALMGAINVDSKGQWEPVKKAMAEFGINA